jgi:hypothetical protein
MQYPRVAWFLIGSATGVMTMSLTQYDPVPLLIAGGLAIAAACAIIGWPFWLP